MLRIALQLSFTNGIFFGLRYKRQHANTNKGGKALIKIIGNKAEDFTKFIKQVFARVKIWFEELLGLRKSELFSIISGKPINPKLLLKVQEEFKALGGFLILDAELISYCEKQGKQLNTIVEVITFNEELRFLSKGRINICGI